MDTLKDKRPGLGQRAVSDPFGTNFTTNKTTFNYIQIPLTCFYAMSDFRIQGNGLSKGIFDLKKLPSG